MFGVKINFDGRVTSLALASYRYKANSIFQNNHIWRLMIEKLS